MNDRLQFEVELVPYCYGIAEWEAARLMRDEDDFDEVLIETGYPFDARA